MSETRSFGLRKLLIGTIPNDFAMATMLAAMPLSLKQTASLKEADQNVTEIYAEEVDYPIESLSEPGQTILATSIADFTPVILAMLKGGIVTGVAPDDKWNAPQGAVDIEKAFAIITKKNLLIELPRVKVNAVINMALQKQGIDQVDLKCPILLPQGGLPPIMISKYADPVPEAGAPQSIAVAVHIANLVGTATGKGPLTYLWTVKSKPAAAADPVMATPAALANAVTVLTTVGVYVFTLTATDAYGIAASDDVAITITA